MLWLFADLSYPYACPYLQSLSLMQSPCLRISPHPHLQSPSWSAKFFNACRSCDCLFVEGFFFFFSVNKLCSFARPVWVSLSRVCLFAQAVLTHTDGPCLQTSLPSGKTVPVASLSVIWGSCPCMQSLFLTNSLSLSAGTVSLHSLFLTVWKTYAYLQLCSWCSNPFIIWP